MGVGLLDHYNIRTDKLDETVHFYQDVLGLEIGPRPNFDFGGAWLYADGQAVVHLVDIAGQDEKMKTEQGPIDHVAFFAQGFDDFKQRLDGKDVAFEARIVPGGQVKQIFINDPNGVTLELNFHVSREP